MSKRKTHKSTDTHQYLGGTVRELFFCTGIWCFVCRFFIISVKMLKLLICNFKYELSELKLCRFTTVFYNTRPSTLIFFWTTLVHRKKIKFWIWQIFNGYKFWVLFCSPGPKVHVNYCHHLASVVCSLSSVNFSHFKLLLRNHLADWNRT
jgi:hypothetical protein